MRELNSSLLIEFGFVVGAICGLMAPPFLLTVELVQGGPKWIGMPEGYGDLLGGVISGTMSLGAGYILWRIGERKKDQAEIRIKAVYADKTLNSVKDFLDEIRDAIKIASNCISSRTLLID